MGSTIVLLSPSATLHRSSTQKRSLYQIQDSPNPLDKRSIQRIGVVVTEPTNTAQPNDINTRASRYEDIDRCLQEGWGASFLHGTEYRGSERRGQSSYQCVGTEGSQSLNSSICQEYSITSTSHPTPHGQLDSSILFKQTRTRSSSLASLEIWTFCLSHQIWVTVILHQGTSTTERSGHWKEISSGR